MDERELMKIKKKIKLMIKRSKNLIKLETKYHDSPPKMRLKNKEEQL